MEILVKKAINGDKEAFIELIDICTVKMYKLAKTRLDDEESIGDAIQETVLSAYKNIKKLRNTQYFNTWLMKILINKCNDIVKKSKVDYIDDYSKIKCDDLVYETSIDEELDFEKILNKLNSDYKVVIVMYYVNRFTTKEISNILEISENTVKTRIRRAKDQLKNYYMNEKII